MSIKKVAVIGAGVMGSGIAAQIANNNVEVLLYDLENDSGLIAAASLQKLMEVEPSQLTHKSVSKLITPLSLLKDLDKLKDCDLVIEAIVEKLSVKQEFYKNASKHLKSSAILASNTSTFQLSQLKSGLDKDLADRLVICHFFNPPRIMRLLELVTSTPNLDLVKFLSKTMGKDVIHCKDTPGFIANRLGCFLMELTLQESIKANASIADIDYVFTKLLNFPSTGIFGLYDLIGLDVMALIAKSLNESLPKTDEFCKNFKEVPEIKKMIEDGYKGRKGKGGFYQLKIEGDTKTKLVLDLISFEYKAALGSKLPYKTINELLESGTQLGDLISGILNKFFSYVMEIHSSIAHDIYSIDKAMQLGCAWKYGPFEMMQLWNLVPKEIFDKFVGLNIDSSRFGVSPRALSDIVDSKPSSFRERPSVALVESSKHFMAEPFNVEKMQNENNSSSYKYKLDSTQPTNGAALNDGSRNDVLLPDNSDTLLSTSDSTKIWQLREDKICFEINSKMHVLNHDVFNNLSKAIDIAEEKGADLIIYSDYYHFSAGADINQLYKYAEKRNTKGARGFIELGQQVMLKLKYAKIPVISCPRGLALGGGCELLLHSDYVVAHQEMSAGLVETSIGLIPGWGGLKELVLRSTSDEDLCEKLKLILEQYKSTSALDFAIRFSHKNVVSIAGRDNLLEYALENKFTKQLTGKKSVEIGRLELVLNKATDDIAFITKLLMNRLNGKLTEEKLLHIEQEVFEMLLVTKNAHVKMQKVIGK